MRVTPIPMTLRLALFKLRHRLRHWWYCHAIWLSGTLDGEPARKGWRSGQVQTVLWAKGTSPHGHVMDYDYWATVHPESSWSRFRWSGRFGYPTTS